MHWWQPPICIASGARELANGTCACSDLGLIMHPPAPVMHARQLSVYVYHCVTWCRIMETCLPENSDTTSVYTLERSSSCHTLSTSSWKTCPCHGSRCVLHLWIPDIQQLLQCLPVLLQKIAVPLAQLDSWPHCNICNVPQHFWRYSIGRAMPLM